jgi:FtsP/CotA-like multicopper oxidase with cupredoxin domain
MITRREMMGAAALAGTTLLVEKASGGLADAVPQSADAKSSTGPIAAEAGRTALNVRPQPPGEPGRDYTPVHTPNGETLPFQIVDGVKVFHLVAEPVEHEFMPGLQAHCWGYNGRTVGPTIEAVEGDRVRIYVTNRLPEGTTVHWHGIRVPNGMDGVAGLTQPVIEPGQTFRYEFTLPAPGTFMYHPHHDDMTQQAMGMMGMFVVHPRDGTKRRVDRDYCIMLSEWRVDPGTSRPVTTEMLDFNVLTMNSKCFPATEPVVASMGERVRIRFGNLGAMDHHPIHLHGFQMVTTETDGGLVPEPGQYPINTVFVPVGSTRAVEFIADNPGDWAMHCHMTHHTMNQMGHDVQNMVGVDTAGLSMAVRKVVPGFMAMGQSGMGDMSDMNMQVPPNSVPMAGGPGPFGTIDMGGMFTIVKVRDHVDGYADVPAYQHPPGTLAVAATPAELARDGIDVPSSRPAMPDMPGMKM